MTNLLVEAEAALDGYRKAASSAYLRAMRAELAKPENLEKEDWEDADPMVLMNDVWYHVAKLLKAVNAWREAGKPALEGKVGVMAVTKAVLEFAADVGNCAMMVADACGALQTTEADLESAEEAVGWKSY